MNSEVTLRSALKAGGAVVLWERVVREALPAMREMLPPGSRVLEAGYGDGLLTCYLIQEYGWRVVGLEVNPEAQRLAEQHARQSGLSDYVDFQCGDPEEIFRHRGQYDGVFIKTVLYNAANLGEYARWLDWILSVLKPGGVFINFATGRANALTQWYRWLRRREYTGLCLYTSQIEALYDARFEIIERHYYGGLSQFLAPVPALCRVASRLEETLRSRHADNSFIVSVIGRRPG
jgi:cyclopropane fatty-acyl-phospholipid synthase-like methyltransferase